MCSVGSTIQNIANNVPQSVSVTDDLTSVLTSGNKVLQTGLTLDKVHTCLTDLNLSSMVGGDIAQALVSDSHLYVRTSSNIVYEINHHLTNPTIKLLSDNVTSLAVGHSHVVMLRTDGCVWGYGDNKQYQLVPGGYTCYDSVTIISPQSGDLVNVMGDECGHGQVEELTDAPVVTSVYADGDMTALVTSSRVYLLGVMQGRHASVDQNRLIPGTSKVQLSLPLSALSQMCSGNVCNTSNRTVTIDKQQVSLETSVENDQELCNFITNIRNGSLARTTSVADPTIKLLVNKDEIDESGNGYVFVFYNDNLISSRNGKRSVRLNRPLNAGNLLTKIGTNSVTSAAISNAYENGSAGFSTGNTINLNASGATFSASGNSLSVGTEALSIVDEYYGERTDDISALEELLRGHSKKGGKRNTVLTENSSTFILFVHNEPDVGESPTELLYDKVVYVYADSRNNNLFSVTKVSDAAYQTAVDECTMRFAPVSLDALEAEDVVAVSVLSTSVITPYSLRETLVGGTNAVTDKMVATYLLPGDSVLISYDNLYGDSEVLPEQYVTHDLPTCVSVLGVSHVSMHAGSVAFIAHGGMVQPYGNKVSVFGANLMGHLGTGNTNVVHQVMQILSGVNVAHVAVGEYVTLFVLQDGRVFGAGRLSSYFNMCDSTTPVQVTAVIPQVSKVWLSNNHVVFMTTSNELLVAGSNQYGQLGNGRLNDRVVCPVTMDVCSAVTGCSTRATTCVTSCNDVCVSRNNRRYPTGTKIKMANGRLC